MFKLDISTEEKRAELVAMLSTFTSKQAVFKYYGVSGNGTNWKVLNSILEELGLGINFFDKKRQKPARYCKNCGAILKRKQIDFCSRSCACSYKNKHTPHDKRLNERIRESVIKHYESLDGIRYHGNDRRRYKTRICPVCGNDRMISECKNPKICHKTVAFYKKNLACFGFDETVLGTDRIVDEYNRIGSILKYEYENNMLSVGEIKEKYSYPYSVEGLTCIMRNMGVHYRSRSEHTRNCFNNGRLTPNYPTQFKTGIYTTKRGETIKFRSSYEEEYCKYLDEMSIDYKYEALRIKYYDTSLGKYRVAIPDFLLTESNEIVEVKSKATFSKQNMLDKFAAYAKAGYTPILRLEHVNYTYNEVYGLDEYKFVLGT